MGRKFVDTSALVEVYRNEPNSPQVQAEIAKSDNLIIAQITLLEMPSAFYGLVRQGTISLAVAQAFISGFELDIPNYTVVPMSTSLIGSARGLLAAHAVLDGLRPADAIQLASALEASSPNQLDAMLTTDAVMARVAKAIDVIVKP